MYGPAHFSIDDQGEIIALVEAHPFASIVAAGPEGPIAAYAPLLVERDEAGKPAALIGHLARANPFGDQVADGAAALAIFRGADAYVSPSFYPTKQEHGRVVPTWNYLAVEAAGPIAFTREPEALRNLVTRLTDRMEMTRAAPWTVSDAPATYVDKLLNAITGVRIAIRSLQGKAKLSQNKSEVDRLGVFDHLSQSRDPLDQRVAAAMAKEV